MVLVSLSNISVSGFLLQVELQLSHLVVLSLRKSSKQESLQNLWTASFRVSAHVVCRR